LPGVRGVGRSEGGSSLFSWKYDSSEGCRLVGGVIFREMGREAFFLLVLFFFHQYTLDLSGVRGAYMAFWVDSFFGLDHVA
jgi:hypothetical protein